ISQPHVIDQGDNWRLVHLPTHRDHFYDVHRYEFSASVEANTDGSPHILSLVEGDSVILELPDGQRPRFSFAETFVVPAAANHYRLVNPTGQSIKVIRASLKAEWFTRAENGWL